MTTICTRAPPLQQATLTLSASSDKPKQQATIMLVASLPPPPPLVPCTYTPGQAYVYLKRFLCLALKELPKHKKYTKDVYVNDRLWITRVRAKIGVESFQATRRSFIIFRRAQTGSGQKRRR